MRLNDVGLPHVSHPEEQVHFLVLFPHADDRVLAEHEGVGAVLGASQLGEHDPRHAGRDDHADHALEAHGDDGRGTLLRSLAGSISGEEKNN